MTQLFSIKTCSGMQTNTASIVRFARLTLSISHFFPRRGLFSAQRNVQKLLKRRICLCDVFVMFFVMEFQPAKIVFFCSTLYVECNIRVCVCVCVCVFLYLYVNFLERIDV